MSERIGPSVTVSRSCCGCKYERSQSYRVQGDSGHDIYCDHPDVDGKQVGDTSWRTPDWCPAIQPPHEAQREAATEAAFRAIAGDEADPHMSPETWEHAEAVAQAILSTLPAAASVEAGERAQIVAWLRDLAENHERPFGLVEDYGSRWALKHAADAIERGEHMAAKGKDQA